MAHQRQALLPLRQHRANEALIVVRTGSKEIIDNHNGFFKPEFVDFLVRYVSDIETKRVKTKAASRHLQEQRAAEVTARSAIGFDPPGHSTTRMRILPRARRLPSSCPTVATSA
jgi:hypothetical protein